MPVRETTPQQFGLTTYLAGAHFTDDDFASAKIHNERKIEPASFSWNIGHIRHKYLARLLLSKFAIQRVLENSPVGQPPLCEADSVCALPSNHGLASKFLHGACDLVVSGFSFMAIHAKGCRHPSDAISSFVAFLEHFDAIAKSLSREHSFTRISNTAVKGAPAGTCNFASSGNGYPAAMCALNCRIKDGTLFFLSPDARLWTSAGSPGQSAVPQWSSGLS